MAESRVKVQNVYKATSSSALSIRDQADQLLKHKVKTDSPVDGKAEHTRRLTLHNGLSVIAVRRKYPGQEDSESIILQALKNQNAPVPKFIAKDSNGLFIQEDVKGSSLAQRLAGSEQKQYEALLVAAVKQLAKVHRLGSHAGLDEVLPVIGVDADWREELISYPVRIGELFDLRPDIPQPQRIVDLLEVRHPRFIKWDARPNKFIKTAKGYVWTDWERAAVRQRLDDLVWLMADETVPEYPDSEQKLIEAFLPYFADGMTLNEAREYFYTLGVLHISVRMGMMLRFKGSHPWWALDKVKKQQDVAISQKKAINLCIRARRWAQHSEHVQVLSPWFADLAKVFLAQK